MGIQENAVADILSERWRQDKKWGEQNHDPFTYLAILMEEVGELAQAALKDRFTQTSPHPTTLEHMREEAVQVAAVALAIVECLDREKWVWNEARPLRAGKNGMRRSEALEIIRDLDAKHPIFISADQFDEITKANGKSKEDRS